MALDPRKQGDRYDKLARAEAAKVQSGDTQARLARYLDLRDQWYATADREDAKIARWTASHPSPGDLAPVPPSAPTVIQTTEVPEPGLEGSWVGYALLGIGLVAVAAGLRARAS